MWDQAEETDTEGREGGNTSTEAERVAEDTWFLDPEAALAEALQGQGVMTAEGRRLQICYYDGPPIPEAPLNLIPVPTARFMDTFAGSLLPLPTRLVIPAGVKPAAALSVRQAFAEMLSELRALRERQRQTRTFPRATDGYYFDPARAFATAVQALPVDLGHPTILGRQLCYYDGEPIPHPPRGLIPLPAEQVADFLRRTRLRPPRHLVFPEAVPVEQRQRHAAVFARLLQEAETDRELEAARLVAEARRRPPPPRGDSLRLFFTASRYTQVMQYASRGLARAFEALGHHTRVSIEADPWERMDTRNHIRNYLDFGPQVVVNINHLNNLWLHPEVFNVTWWQDPMPSLQEGRPLGLRPRDLVYSVSGNLDPMLRDCGARRVLRQGFCVDTRVFRPDPQLPRRPVMVFAGSSYRHKLTGEETEARALRRLEDLLEGGEPVDRMILKTLAEEIGLAYDDVLWRLFGHTIRERTVRWMCELFPDRAEVYGRGWADDPVVAPHYRGEVAHGPDLARIYQGAAYALVAHPFDLNSQRIAEVGASGCIPVVYDCRVLANPPHWDQECLFFHSRAGLAECFGCSPPADPQRIGAARSYDVFAKRILEAVGWPKQGDA